MRAIDADALKREIVDFKVKLCPENRDYGVGYFSALSVVEGMLACAPTLTLDDLRPKGRWVKKPWKLLGCVLRYDTVCSECGFDAPEFAAGGGSTVLTKFCHNCGAKMENGEANE